MALAGLTSVFAVAQAHTRVLDSGGCEKEQRRHDGCAPRDSRVESQAGHRD